MLKNIRFICAFLAVFMLCSCSAGKSTDDPNVDKLKDGDLIVRENSNEINISVSFFDTFNPIMTKSSSVAEFMKTICEPLFEYDERYNPIGVLAESYTVSDDGLTVSFDLKDAKFHDGTKLLPEDVIYTVNMIKNNDTLYGDCVKYIKSIYSDEGGKVYIQLSRPIVNFIGMLCFPIVKKDTPQTVDANYMPNGTGAYKYYGKQNAGKVIFSANADWHGGEAGLKNIAVNILKDDTTVAHAFDAGEIDVLASAFAASENSTPRGEYTTNEYTSNALTFLGINNYNKKLSGKLTRQAIELLCDRKKIIDVEVYSKGVPVRIPINPSAWFFPEMSEKSSDYETVASILATDGWTKTENGYFRSSDSEELTLKILVNADNPEKIRIAQNIAESLNNFGIPASVLQKSFDEYKSYISSKDYELFVGEVNIDSSLNPSFLTASSGNYFGYQSDDMENTLKEMAKTSDSTKMMDLSAQYADIFTDDMPFVPLFFRTQNVIYNKHISGISPPTFYHVYRNMQEWYVSQTR